MAYEDLLKDSSKPDPDDKNYFIVTITDLFVDKVYPIEFRWKYKDGSFGTWGAVKKLTISSESVPTPSAPVVTSDAGMITVAWDGKDSTNATLLNIKSVDVYINGIYYGSIFRSGSAGRIAVPLKKGTYSVTFVAVSVIGNQSSTSTATSITVNYDADEAQNDLLNKLEASADVIANASNQITSINSNGVTVFSSSSTAIAGNRIVMNSEGIAGFQSGNNANNPSFAIRINEWTSSNNQVIPAGSAYFKGTVNATDGIFTGYVQAGNNGMRFGSNVNSSNNGLYVNADNYWYSTGDFKVGSSNYYFRWDTSTLTIKGDMSFGTADYINANGSFSFGGGILDGTTSQIVIDLFNGNAGFYIVQMPPVDDDGYAGDPTISINSTGKISKGRRIIHNRTTIPTVASWDPVSKTGTLTNITDEPTGRIIKGGDLIMVGE